MGMVEAAERAEQLVGLALLVSEQQGKGGTPAVESAVAEMVCYAQMIRMSLDWSCRNFETTPSGMIHPHVLGVNVGKYYFAAGYHQIVQKLHDLAGGLVLTLPTEAELRNPESGKYLRKYLHTTPDVDIEERMRIYNLIRDLTADAYGGWHLVTTLQAGGGLVAQRTMMNRTYDLERARRKAKKAAGIAS
jgi:4-hydroxybutyryl-CoA dehydratase/vinylacetyl-CoA-Delta-isomerase